MLRAFHINPLAGGELMKSYYKDDTKILIWLKYCIDNGKNTFVSRQRVLVLFYFYDLLTYVLLNGDPEPMAWWSSRVSLYEFPMRYGDQFFDRLCLEQPNQPHRAVWLSKPMRQDLKRFKPHCVHTFAKSERYEQMVKKVQGLLYTNDTKEDNSVLFIMSTRLSFLAVSCQALIQNTDNGSV